MSSVSTVGSVIAGLVGGGAVLAYQRSRTGRWRPTWAEWKSQWDADRRSPGYWAFYAVFFGAILVFALLLPDQSLGWRVFEAITLSVLTLMGCIQFVRSLRARRDSGV